MEKQKQDSSRKHRTPSMSRRSFIGGASLAGATGLAGCLSSLGTGGGSEGGESLVLESLDVGGSPGGEINILPSEKVVLLDFFATWCAPCKPEMANLNEVRSEFGDDLFIVSITSESDREAVKEFWERYEGTWPVTLDSELSATQRFNVNQIPTITILDRERNEVWRHVGLAGTRKMSENIRKALE